MPEGWRLLEEDSSQVTFVPENYPEESVDMVSVQLTEKDPAFDSYTQKLLKKNTLNWMPLHFWALKRDRSKRTICIRCGIP